MSLDLKKGRKEKFLLVMKKYWILYLMFFFIAAYILLLRYWPIVMSIVMSFKDFNLRHGIWDSDFCGFQNYVDIFRHPDILRALKNTVEISLLSMFFSFFPPIIMAILLFEMVILPIKKSCQTIVFIPHFFSWVVVYGLIMAMVSERSGLINNILYSMTGKTYDFLISQSAFRPILIISKIWKEVGWGTIVYTAALTGIDNEVYEAAAIDGAGPITRIIHISIPGIKSIVAFALIMSIGNILRVGSEAVLLLYNNATIPVADVLDTWVLREGLGKMEYNLGNTVGIVQSVFGFVFVLVTNGMCRKFIGRSLW